MTIEEYKQKFTEEDAVGWDAIDAKLNELYKDQEPRHYAAELPFDVGGKDPLQGVSIYDSQKQEFHRHFISYGMSDLYYDEECADNIYSGWGFEFTFRLKPFEEDNTDPIWVSNLMNNLARYVYSSGKWFSEYHAIPTSGTIRANTNSDIVGLIFVPDPELGEIQTPNGDLTFLQMVGITSKELEELKKDSSIDAVKALANKLREYNPLLITDLLRK